MLHKEANNTNNVVPLA